MFKSKGAVLALLGFASVCASSAFADPKVEEKVVAPASAADACVYSGHGAHVACVTRKGSRTVVIIDGEVGPKFDQVLMACGSPPTNGVTSLEPATRIVVLSDDGNHSAYFAMDGNDTVLIVDNKEALRLPYAIQMASGCPLTISPGGKHFYFARTATSNSPDQFYMDGKVVTSTVATNVPVVFSNDDARYALVAANPSNPEAHTLVVDGKDMGAIGDNPQFSGEGKFVISILRQGDAASMMIDGKLIAKTPGIAEIFVAKAGNGFIPEVIHREPNGAVKVFLVVNNKPQEATACKRISRVIFSPDGKHWAAHCENDSGVQEWVVADGKKGEVYKQVDDKDMCYSADSSKMVYVGQNNGFFVVTNGEESDASDLMAYKPTFSANGAHLCYGTSMNNDPNISMVIDGKATKRRSANPMSFSADGSRRGFICGIPSQAGTLVVDGKDVEGFDVKNFSFSADGKHLEFAGTRLKDQKSGLFVDNTLVYEKGGVAKQTFTPDGKHLFWIGVEPQASGAPLLVLYCDGKAVSKFENKSPSPILTAGAWDVSADGVLSVVGFQDDSVKRLQVTAGSDSSVDTLLAGAAGKR